MARTKMELSVEGMAGEGVVRNIETTLGSLGGVEYAHVNLGAKKVTIEFDDAVIASDRLIRKVASLGFDPHQL